MSAELAILNKAKNQSGHTVVIPDYKLDDQIDISEKVFGNSTVDVHDVFDDDSCLLTYQFNNSVNDLSGSYNGINNGVTFNDNGVFNKSGVFNGSSNFTNVLLHSHLNISMSFWAKFANDTNIKDIFDARNHFGLGLMIYAYDGVLAFGNGGAEPDSGLLDVSNIDTTMWHMYSFITDDSNTVSMYIDGVLQVSKPYTTAIVVDTSTKIGCSVNNTQFFIGELDQFRIFGKSLSQEELTHLYTEGTTVSKYSGTTDVRKIHDVFNDGSAVATYTMDGNVKDLGGSYDGTPTNISYDKGKFYGSRSTVVNNSDISTTTLTFPITLSFWLKPITNRGTSLGENAYLGTNNNVNSTCSGFTILGWAEADSNLSLFVGDGSSQTSDAFNTSGLIGKWSFITVVVDSSYAKMYVDNELVVSITQNISNSKLLHIGNQGDMSRYSNAQIDQLRIFNRVLTESEIQTLYIETIPRPLTVNDSDIFRDNSIVAHYKFDGNILDETGNYDGALGGNVEYGIGKFNQSLKTDGVDTELLLPSGVFAGSGSISASCWSIGNGTFHLGDGIIGTTYNSIRFSLTGVEIGSGSSAPWLLDLGSSIDRGDVDTISHYVFSFNSATLEVQVYQNGKLIASATSDRGRNTTNSLSVNYTINGSHYVGELDQLRIFNRVLTPLEVLKLYDEKPPYKAIIQK